MAVAHYFENIRNSAVSIFEGMAVTLSYCFRKPVTIQYPDRIERPVTEMLPEGYRGLLEVDTSICSGCLLCQRTCPIECIVIEVQKDPETKERYLTRFDIDEAKCMHCGLCSEECATGSIRHTPEFEGATASVVNLVMRFVRPGTKVMLFKPTKASGAGGADAPGARVVARPASKPIGECLREARRVWDADAQVPMDKARGPVTWGGSNGGRQ